MFSWSYQHLPAQAARAFRLLGLHPGREVDAYALATLYDYYQHTAKLATNFLGHQDLRPETPVPPGPVPAFTDHDDTFRRPDAERHNLLAVAEHAARDPGSQVPTNLSTLLWRSLDTAGYYDEAATLHPLAVAAGIDAFYADTGRLHDAIRFYEQAIAIRGQLDVPHHNVTDQTSAPGLAAYVMYKLDELRDDQNRLDEALTHLHTRRLATPMPPSTTAGKLPGTASRRS